MSSFHNFPFSRPLCRLAILAVCLIIFPGQSLAIIGNDLPQLRKTYGSAASAVNGWLFCHDNLSIAVFMDHDRSAMEVFSRDPQAKDQAPLESSDIDKILSMEGGNLNWNESLTQGGLPVWIRSDNKVLARISYSEGKRVLVVMLNEK